MTHTITITTEGALQFTWDDELRFLLELGTGSIRRASHVEPTADCRFTADMGPCSGPVLGPYETHGEALQAEREWLAAWFAK